MTLSNSDPLTDKRCGSIPAGAPHYLRAAAIERSVYVSSAFELARLQPRSLDMVTPAAELVSVQLTQGRQATEAFLSGSR